MGVVARLIGLGPVLLSGVIILCLLLTFSMPALAPFAPFAGIILPVFISGILAWRRAYPAAIGWLRRRVSRESFWNAALPDLKILKVITTDKSLARLHPMAGKVVLLEDRSGNGYACKVLRVADVVNSYETTTEDERLLLLDRMAKAIEGLGDVEAKLVIDRSPDAGETACIILWSRIVDGDERAAVHSVESASRTLQRSMDRIGITMVDDASYLRPSVSLRSATAPARRIHGLALALSSIGTAASSAMCLGPGAGPLPILLLASGIFSLLVSQKLIKASSKAGCRECPGRPHVHISLGGAEAYQVDSEGVLKEYREGCVVYSKYLAFTGNNSRDLSSEDIERRLPMNLKSFSTLLYTLTDFRIALHIKPQPVGDTVRIALAKADFYGMDAQVGGAVSGYYKANRSMNLADRIMRGERPYMISGVVQVRARVDGQYVDESRALDILDKQIREAESFLDTMNISTKEVKDGWGSVLANRFLYLPLQETAFEYNPVPRIRALTRDFIAISPLAFRRRPLMPKEGLYLGKDEMGRAVHFNPSLLPNPHVMVLGPPGKGKSTLVKTMLFRLNQLTRYTGTGRPPAVLIIDPAGEYADKAEDLRAKGLKVTVIDLIKSKYNPLLLAGLEPRQRATRLVDYIFANIMPLDRYQSGVLYQAIMLAYKKLGGIDEYNPETWTDDRAAKATFKHIYEYIAWRAEQAAKTIASRGGSPELDPGVTLLTELARLFTPMATGSFALDRTDLTIEQLIDEGGIVIVSFKTATVEGMQVRMSDELQKLMVWSILEHIHSYMTSLHAEEGVRLIVIIDEGHKFLQGKYETIPLSQHLREGRKFGASYIIITHLPKDLPPDIERIVGTIFIFGFGHPGEARRVAELLNLTEEEYEKIMSMKTGELYVKWIEDPRPLYFVFEPDEKALVRKREERLWQLYRMQ
jgi:energy-coupling factor transporter ATP-binding protein EcfA2